MEARALPGLHSVHTAIERVSPPCRGRGEVTNMVLQQEPLEGPGRDPAFGHYIGAGHRARWIRTPLTFLQMTTALKGLVVCGLLPHRRRMDAF